MKVGFLGYISSKFKGDYEIVLSYFNDLYPSIGGAIRLGFSTFVGLK